MSICQVTIDVRRCSGIGMCEAGRPDVFEVGHDGHARLLNEHPDVAEYAALQDVASQCPTQSLTVALVD